MLGIKFARLVESHSDALAHALVRQLHTNLRTQSFRRITADELRADVHELYFHLTEWMVTKSEGDVQKRQERLGEYRAAEQIPIEEFLWALTLSKRNIFEFLRREVPAEGPCELMFEMEFLQSLDDFFDRATYHAIIGYLHHQAKELAKTSPQQLHA
jgi:hypothetical protein